MCVRVRVRVCVCVCVPVCVHICHFCPCSLLASLAGHQTSHTLGGHRTSRFDEAVPPIHSRAHENGIQQSRMLSQERRIQENVEIQSHVGYRNNNLEEHVSPRSASVTQFLSTPSIVVRQPSDQGATTSAHPPSFSHAHTQKQHLKRKRESTT